jgi:hypothetical protein
MKKSHCDALRVTQLKGLQANASRTFFPLVENGATSGMGHEIVFLESLEKVSAYEMAMMLGVDHLANLIANHAMEDIKILSVAIFFSYH